MATNKKWFVKFIVGNPRMFSKIRTSPGSPMVRGRAKDFVGVIETNGWRGWVEDVDGHRIYETTIEKKFNHTPT